MSIKHWWVSTDDVSTIPVPATLYGIRPHPCEGSRVKSHSNSARRDEISATRFLEHVRLQTQLRADLTNPVCPSTSYRTIVNVRRAVGRSVEVRVEAEVFATPAAFQSSLRSAGLTRRCIAHGRRLNRETVPSEMLLLLKHLYYLPLNLPSSQN